MKRILVVTILGVVAMGGAAFSGRVQAQPEHRLDDAAVNAKVDARLKQVLSGLRQQAASGQEMAVAGR
jgi:hypothetical protein